MSRAAERVMVIEDSTHEKEVVLANIKAYGKFVTPGSYMLVQDTRCGRWKPADAIEDFLSMPEVRVGGGGGGCGGVFFFFFFFLFFFF
jgi:cephalosporin hydroxylase